MKTKYFIASLGFALASLFINGAAVAANDSKSVDGVVAVVSGSVITRHDLESRFELFKRQIRQKIPKEQVKAIYKKILNDLINEEVQQQYADSQKITVEDSEVTLAISEIEKRNNMTHGTFYNISEGYVDSAKAKIRSEVVRQKIVNKKLRPRIVISKGEVDRLIANINNGVNNWEKEVYQIFISHPKGGENKSIENKIQKVYEQLTNEGIDFHTLAKTISDDSTAKAGKGGLLGWFGAGELSPSLDNALIKLEIGETSKPISTPNGWHILYVADKKVTEKFSSDPVTEYKLYNYQVSLADIADKKSLLKQFKNDVKKFERLGDIEELTLKHAEDIEYNSSGDLGWVDAKNLPVELRDDIEDMDINDFSNIIQSDDKLIVYHLSNKRDVLPKNVQAYRQKLQNRVMGNRLELAAKRFMRDLRRQAYVEIRF